MVIARFQAEVGGGSVGAFSSMRKAVYLGVRPAVFVVPPLPHHLTILNQDTSNHGIRMNSTPSPPTQFDGPGKVLTVLGGQLGFHGNQKVTRRATEPK